MSVCLSACLTTCLLALCLGHQGVPSITHPMEGHGRTLDSPVPLHHHRQQLLQTYGCPPTSQPTSVPTHLPTQSTESPTDQPTKVPTEQPTKVPTQSPTPVPRYVLLGGGQRVRDSRAPTGKELVLVRSIFIQRILLKRPSFLTAQCREAGLLVPDSVWDTYPSRRSLAHEEEGEKEEEDHRTLVAGRPNAAQCWQYCSNFYAQTPSYFNLRTLSDRNECYCWCVATCTCLCIRAPACTQPVRVPPAFPCAVPPTEAPQNAD